MSENTKGNMNIIIIGVAVGVLCCVISGVAAYFMLRSSDDNKPVISPGLIGGPCENGKCNAPNSVCKFDICYEQCKGRNAWPCETDDDIPYVKKYWCDYSGCPPWQPPKPVNSEGSGQKLTVFEEALKQQTAIDAETAKLKIAQQESNLQKEKEAKANAAIIKAEQDDYCQCISLQKRHVECESGFYGDGDNKDGNAEQDWCYVKGGTNCRKATPAKHPDLGGSAWRLC